ncbi:MAG: MFS transporter [Rhizobiales bacterium]|nr:MFS transporter [Hyphomicrobiales bacterium]MBI3672759.1 MFS transporter [Hyphomicrobiales bacterium]
MTVERVAEGRARGTHESTIFAVIAAVSLGHFLNDLMQSLIPAVYPLLKQELGLSFAQIGVVTLVFQGTASILQPLVGLYTDRRPLPYALAAGMGSTLLGLVLLAHSTSYRPVLIAVALIGLGSSIFHPESSRVARLAAGRRPGFAQSFFQVGGNVGSSLGPLLAAFVVLPNGQSSLQWFAAVALVGMGVLTLVGNWYRREGGKRALAGKVRGETPNLPAATVRLSIAVLLALMFSKFVYMASFSSYYIFYLMERYGVSVGVAQTGLFAFLASVAAGTIVGGPIGDRIGRKRVIWVSILGVFPFSAALPFVGFEANVALAAASGLVLASAFPAMVVYAQELVPSRVGMIAGLFFGFAFGIGGIGAAAIGMIADRTSITQAYYLCSFLPLIGLLAVLLPDLRRKH